MPVLDDIVTKLTPEHLEGLIVALATRQRHDQQMGVDVSSLVSKLVSGYNLGTGAARSQAYRQIMEAIEARVGLIPGMRYIKSSD